MTHNAPFDRDAFVDAKRDLDNALATLGARLEQYFEKPANVAALQAARSELQLLLTLLKTVGLKGVAAFCTELEIVLDELASQPGRASALYRDVAHHAMFGLAHYFDELANGADNAELRLFAQYQELQQLRGLERSFELDLFYPDLAVTLPQPLPEMHFEGDASSRLKVLRSQYQQSLLRLLRREGTAAALQSMQQVVHDVMCSVPQDNSRAFWWIAGGLLDCLRLDGLPPELNARNLLGRIDRQICRVIDGSAAEVRPVLNEMLYLVGRSHSVSDLVVEIKRVYALDSCLPKPATLLPGDVSRILGAMRDLLRVTEESWERCTQCDRTACTEFIEYAGQLAEQSRRLNHNTLQYLTQQLQAFSQYASGPEHVRLIALDMAMALLLLRGGIRYYGSLDSRFQEQARIISGRMQAAVQRQPEDAQRLTELVHLHCRMGQGDVLVHLFNEMLANLQYVEQGLNAFFNDAARRGELTGLLRLLGQIQGGLRLASLELPEQLLVTIQNNINRFAQSDDIPETLESAALAEAVSALEDYLQHLAHGQMAETSLLLKSLEALSGLRSVSAQAAVATEPLRVPAETQQAVSEDQELLEVFLEEAQEVLRGMRDNLEVCQLHPGSHKPLESIRRGFHTLKGSGRMVGLTDLGDVAWCVERALGKWLQDNKPAVPGLLHFITTATQKYTDWVDALNRQGGVNIEANELIAAALQIENGMMPELPVKAQIQSEVDGQLLLAFLEGADDLCPKISAGLRAWRDRPEDEEPSQLLKRLLHTFKGNARMAGAMRVAEIVHQMEERILSAAQTRPEPALLDGLENHFDDISVQLESLRNIQVKEEIVPQHWRAHDQAAPDITVLEAGAEHVLPGTMLRVRSDVIDRLVNDAGEICVARSRMETEMHSIKEGLLELTGSVSRLRKQLREVEIQSESQMQARVPLIKERAEQFDPLEIDRFTRLHELVRFMNESVHDVQTVQQGLLRNFDETVAAITAQARLGRALQQDLMSIRRVPFASIGERLYQIVRQTAKELNKRANLELSGTEVELDRAVLEKMTAPFEHLLRNALAHGIENSLVRTQSGKSPVGEIRLELRHENNEIIFEFSDDGAGLDLAALRDKAQAKSLLRSDETVSDERLAQLIFVSGISTANEVNEVAGRGIGMDVVRSEIAALGGRIDISSKKGTGTQFIIRLPLTMAVTHILIVRCGNVNYAIPSTLVEQVRQVKSTELAQFYDDRRVTWQGRSYAFYYLPHLLGNTERTAENLPHNSVLLLRSGEQHIALHVDGLLGNQEAVIKNIGPQLAQLPWIAGATVLGDGALALILNPAQLVQRNAAAAPKSPDTSAGVLHTQPLVMVVDDSLTVRKIITRQLVRAGYQVVTARDGVDALEQLGEINPAVMLLDIEMPRMDGFELAQQLRRDAKTQDLPILMITSRSADKHRDYAMQLGVNAYLGKPYREEELLRLIAGFIVVPEMV